MAAASAVATGPLAPSDAERRALDEELERTSSTVLAGLKQTYRTSIQPLEEQYNYGAFYSPVLQDADFEAPPMVLVLGQYSTGKTSFIKYMVQREFPGQRVGPEPTTDRFTAIMYGATEKVIPGNAAVVDRSKPFSSLSHFGASFLNKFEVSMCPAPILKRMYFVDTPGVLSGEKQRVHRTYNFPEVVEWEAQVADRILLLFDAHKLDISDEFKQTIEKLRGHDDKIRVVLNKSDMVDRQSLMRVYGALMWSLGKVIQTPEVLRVYVGSFWDQPLNAVGEENRELFEREEADLIGDLRGLPRQGAVRRINEIVKRARRVKVHALIISHLKSQMPMLFGKSKKQQQLSDNLESEFETIMRKYHIPRGDMPDVKRVRLMLKDWDFSKLPKLNQRLIDNIDRAMARDMPRLMNMLPGTEQEARAVAAMGAEAAQVGAGTNPFDEDDGGGAASGGGDGGMPTQTWLVSAEDKRRYDNTFHALPLSANGMVSGQNVKPVMMQSQLPVVQLKKIFQLADVDKDGSFDADEFAVCMWLIEQARRDPDRALPDALPAALVPPSKREDVTFLGKR